ncbi:Two-component hybrid sensor and regulator [Desulfamplus magnetovallimortis]|uniref:histidine kinase n=1 Tax=Desulfamplus magnetovallimortis TaxID=1246637 RepID=A0A1W1HGG8_9BACT|nr:hybrid sensor histidine kinase/response regulator [Desulfamplus magnetovallimortis]SLM31579.1 Two-component hybrid sensor and regulator [Desulfamplus magnetovallimortis]
MDLKDRILVVDDEPNNLRLMGAILQETYRLAFAVNGEQALEAAEKTLPDCILLDVMMPGMDGYETCRQLKSKPGTEKIPVIFVTTRGEIQDEAQGLAAGAVDYITKPINPCILKARLKNHLALKHAREEIEAKNISLERQNKSLIEAAALRDDVDRITKHDLKNPLNPIITLSSLLMGDRSVASRHREHLEFINKAAYSMLEMINHSLDIYKMETGKYQVHTEPENILFIIERIIKGSANMMRDRKISVKIQIEGQPIKNGDSFIVFVEELLFYSMLSNLVKNAIEASPEGESISIDIFNENKMSVIRVTNRGVVPESIRSRFFDKYITHGKVGGNGLGTYSAILIARSHGGDIELDTSHKGVTVVSVRMPDINHSKQTNVLVL